ncbi:MAG: 3-phosphoshikimate 1-carboxyvinyltransferase [Gemmatimonadota bacterium]|nr:MAG: 3-phosphoshikimate 1-carboxyvinyltransferase [Gemmatimonadota bacterium]
MSEVLLPGDKSITQRALILAALAEGESRLTGLLSGADPQSTAGVLRALGADVPPPPADGSTLRVRGVGLSGFKSPEEDLDFGNSGTGARLMMGVLAGQHLSTTLTGDVSLCSRPMRRVTEPLSEMGATFRELGASDRLPVEITGGPLNPLRYESPVGSAQVKSSILLAGLTGGAATVISEPRPSRDHTERMLSMVGAAVISHEVDGRWQVELRAPPEAIAPLDFGVPSDFSSAAFFLVLGLLGGAGPELTLREVGLNPTRTGMLGALVRMGASSQDLTTSHHHPPDAVEEPVGDLTVRPASLKGIELGEADTLAILDEIPILAVAASRAEGSTRVTGVRELRVKESDRITALVENFRVLGLEVEELDDGLEIEGTDRPVRGEVDPYGDHRIAMAFGILGALPGNDITIRNRNIVDVSFPGFWRTLDSVAPRAGLA